MIRAILIDKQSPFLGEECALCKQPLAPGEELVICPEDGSRHHVPCWRSNGNKCTAYGCRGQGQVVTTDDEATSEDDPQEEQTPNQPRFAGQSPRQDNQSQPQNRSKVRVLPSTNYGCAQSCLLISIAIALLIFALGCFGLWAIADYIMIDILGWQYRTPFAGMIINAIPNTITFFLLGMIR